MVPTDAVIVMAEVAVVLVWAVAVVEEDQPPLLQDRVQPLPVPVSHPQLLPLLRPWWKMMTSSISNAWKRPSWRHSSNCTRHLLPCPPLLPLVLVLVLRQESVEVELLVVLRRLARPFVRLCNRNSLHRRTPRPRKLRRPLHNSHPPRRLPRLRRHPSTFNTSVLKLLLVPVARHVDWPPSSSTSLIPRTTTKQTPRMHPRSKNE